jgi:hypothetical protein
MSDRKRKLKIISLKKCFNKNKETNEDEPNISNSETFVEKNKEES